jgi:hypothetical protein
MCAWNLFKKLIKFFSGSGSTQDQLSGTFHSARTLKATKARQLDMCIAISS